ncbi:MAG: alpha-L-arabinofuranosidase C-terminal domain-containing protein [Bacteroidota bacterium]|nr:alpha-L-arabinofuranosidase C-terminal domain-containing protein [Bacteroidota bacterium]
MNLKNTATGLLVILFLIAGNLVLAQSGKIYMVKANELKADIQPTMWGVFFEDINLGADGGIYAELVKNRSFEFTTPLMGWTIKRKQFTEGDVLVLNRKESNTANPRYLQVTVKDAVKGTLSLINEGFRGMGIKNGLRYDFSVMFRQKTAGVKLHVNLIDPKGDVIGEAQFTPEATGNEWKKQAVSFTATATEPKAKLCIWFEGTGVIDLDMISLFPGDTWKNRPGGFRADMVQMLADMKPGFIRFPGGCIVEGRDLNNRYQWKKTIGPIEDRQLIMNRWNTEFAHRPTPDYFQTFGLGFFEYFQLAEDIGAEPLPILNCGMACQFNTAESVALDEIGPYVQDALDLIEFANGDVTTKWGKIRADMGHPKPFNLKMMGVGNENWGPQYLERLRIFRKAIKDKYPDFKLVCSSGTDPNGDRFDYLNGELRKMNADLIDEHYYRGPEWFTQNVTRYDNYPRNASKIFAGEYAAQSDKIASPDNKNNLLTAISEAAFMTGLERNADVVNMASYAPLFAHVEGWQWTPDLIWVDNLHVYGTPNYYVQKLFSLYKGTNVVPLLLNNQTVTGQDGTFGTACIDTKTNEIIVKFVNAASKAQDVSFVINGVKKLQSKGIVTELTSDHPDDINTMDHPGNIEPKDQNVVVKNKTVKLSAKPYSLNVIRVKML